MWKIPYMKINIHC